MELQLEYGVFNNKEEKRMNDLLYMLIGYLSGIASVFFYYRLRWNSIPNPTNVKKGLL